MSLAACSRPVVLCGPSGVGKSTLIKRLFEEFPNAFGFSVSHTTRTIRPGEVDGKSYHFVSREEFQRRVDNGEFLEYAQFGGNMYGTTVRAVQDVSTGPDARRALLDIDAQGVRLIKDNHSHLNPIYIFLSPPAYSTLKHRLESRATDSAEAISKRLVMALHELHYARKPGMYDCVIINDDLERAYALLRKAVHGMLDEQYDKVPAVDADEQEAIDALKAAGESLD
ncbi:guanylate kinase [Malassezia cuniculi]|uniref:Guanylate kinase n=1 Tax=Malassezia cuniculi TaxID=948313 RepID=A0AAF0J6I6_9BASI|nr:guanylate kinase [Malassezia cuniculi]